MTMTRRPGRRSRLMILLGSLVGRDWIGLAVMYQ